MRKLMTWLLYALLVLVVAMLAAGQAGLLEGKAPTDLGVVNGRLKPPSRTENSVSSQAGLYPDHPMKAYAEIAPIQFTGEGRAAIDRIRRIVESTPGARVDPGGADVPLRAVPDAMAQVRGRRRILRR